MESVIGIYKSLNAAVSVHLPQLQIRKNDVGSDKEDVIKRGGDSSGHAGDSPLPTSEESNPRPRPKQMLEDNLQSFEFESENDDAGNYVRDASHTHLLTTINKNVYIALFSGHS